MRLLLLVGCCVVAHVATDAQNSFLKDLFRGVQDFRSGGKHAEALKLLQDADKMISHMKNELLDRVVGGSENDIRTSSAPNRCGNVDSIGDHTKEGLHFNDLGDYECASYHFEVDAQKFAGAQNNNLKCCPKNVSRVPMRGN
jgi:hypothetical protein